VIRKSIRWIVWLVVGIVAIYYYLFPFFEEGDEDCYDFCKNPADSIHA
jgi:hypothetical protein